MSRTSAAPAISIRACDSHDDLKLCVELQRRVWNFSDEDLVPAAMFVVAQHTGGHAYCAFDGETAVGFALAFSTEHLSGEHRGRRIWHSHMVGVLPEYQNRGVGRMIKLHQREEALRMGIATIEWTYDPLELRNAHFNIARLGAIVRRYIPDCYGGTTSPLHGGLPTDRFVAEWHVGSDRVNRLSAGGPGPVSSDVEIAVPTALHEWKNSDPARALRVQQELRRKCTDLFARGYAVTGFRRESENGVYVLERYEN